MNNNISKYGFCNKIDDKKEEKFKLKSINDTTEESTNLMDSFSSFKTSMGTAEFRRIWEITKNEKKYLLIGLMAMTVK